MYIGVRDMSKNEKKKEDVKIASFRTSGGSMIFIPYSDPKSLERILEGVKKLREESKEGEKE
jgi:hypothetical protein